VKLLVDDDPDRMVRRFQFHVNHEELMEYSAGVTIDSLKSGSENIAAVLLLLFRIYVAETRGTMDADLRVRMHEMRDSLRAGAGSLQEGQESAVPGLLPPGEEDILDAEFTDEPGDGAEEEA